MTDPVLLALVLAAPALQHDELPVLRPDRVHESEIRADDGLLETPYLLSVAQQPTRGAAWRVEVQESGPYTIELRSLYFDPYLVLRETEEAPPLAEDDDGLGIGVHARLVVELEPGRSYRLQAGALREGRGAYTLAMRTGPPAPLSASERREAELADGRERVMLYVRIHGANSAEAAYALDVYAAVLFRWGIHDEARAAWERALEIRREVLGPEHSEVGTVHNNLGVLAQERGDLVAARSHYERALAIREAALDPFHTDVAQSLSNLSALLLDQGDAAASRPLAERALAIRERALGPLHPEVAVSLNDLGRLEQTLGNPAVARRYFERALALRLEALGPTNELVATSLANLATVLAALGDLEGARELAERSLAVREELWGPDHPQVAVSLSHLGNIQSELGDDAGALRSHERALAIRERTLDPSHPYLGATLHNVALQRAVLGDTEGALTLLERALAILEEVHGPRHPDVARVLDRMATVEQRAGDLVAARPLAERALAIQEEVLGERHPDTLTGRNNLANLLKEQGELRRARALFERVLELREEIHGPRHPEVALCLNNVASVLDEQGDLAGARPLYERALAIWEETLAPDDARLASVLNNLGILAARRGDRSRARELYERSLAIRETSLGPRHPDVAYTLSNLGNLQLLEGDLEEARHNLERALAILEEAWGASHPLIATVLTNLSTLRWYEGDARATRELLERALAIDEDLLGPEHPSTITCLNNLANVLEAEGDLEAAQRQYERVLASLRTLLGPRHPHVAAATQGLARVLADRGELRRAWDVLSEAKGGRREHVERTIATLTEGESFLYLSEMSGHVGMRVGLAARLGDGPSRTEAYEDALAWKGQVGRVTVAGRRRLLAGLAPEEDALVDRLRDVQGRLSRLALGGSGAASRHLERQLAALREERGDLERRLRRVETDGLRGEPISWSELRAAVPEGVAVVDLLAHRGYEPNTRSGSGSAGRTGWLPARYSAWITRRESSAPVRVDLGPMGTLETAIEEFLRSLVELNGATALAAGRGESVRDVDSGSTGARSAANARLRELLWEPLEAHLDGVETVVVSPDRALATVPMQVLVDADGRFLLEERGFVYAADVVSLVRGGSLARKEKSGGGAAGSFLAVGGVDYLRSATPVRPAAGEGASRPSNAAQDGPGSGETLRGGFASEWAPLPASGEESRVVVGLHAETFAESGRRLLLAGAAATEERLKAELPRHAICHLATHGFFQPEGLLSLWSAANDTVASGELADAPGTRSRELEVEAERLVGMHPGLLSGLVCAGASRAAGEDDARDDGYLTAEEVTWLDLSGVDLVVLSACETGLGRAASGEGLLGLCRAFRMAGAETVISSLWSVQDESTAELMRSFYRNFFVRGMGKYEALRAAQLEILRDNRERHGEALPSTWGAFVLSGSWR